MRSFRRKQKKYKLEDVRKNERSTIRLFVDEGKGMSISIFLKFGRPEDIRKGIDIETISFDICLTGQII